MPAMITRDGGGQRIGPAENPAGRFQSILVATPTMPGPRQ
jgi:hypothetical protein